MHSCLRTFDTFLFAHKFEKKLSTKYQSYPKLTKIDAFKEKNMRVS